MENNAMSKVENEIESTSNQVEVETTEQTTASTENVSNAAFDSMVEDATRTQAQEREQAKEEKAQDAPTALSQEQAAQYAITALDSVASLTAQATGKPVELNGMIKGVFAALVTPCVMKHGATIQRLMSAPKQVDLDSKLPEMMAALGICGAGYLIYQQAVEIPSPNGQEAQKSGNQSE